MLVYLIMLYVVSLIRLAHICSSGLDFVPVAAQELPVSFIFSACAACLSKRVECWAFHLVGLGMLPHCSGS